MIEYLKNPSSLVDFKIKQKALKYVMLNDELYKRSTESLLLKCLDKDESMRVMAEVHEGICESHRSGPKMRWLIHRHGYYWPSMVANCISYAKG